MNPGRDSINILHVDDEPGFADMVAAFLKREDDRFSIDTATRVDEGLERLDDGDYQCVISDYDMPGRSGIEFLKIVRETRPDLPFILYTAKGSEEVASDAISSGATDYLQKESGSGHYELLANRIDNAITQAQSQQAQRHLRELAESTNQSLIIFTADWSELQFINSAYEEVWGQPAKTLRDNPTEFLNVVHPSDRDRVREAMDRVSGGDTVQLECRVNPSQDAERWVAIQADPIYDDAGDTVRVAAVSADITQRKEHERELERHKQVVESLMEPAFTIDDAGDIRFVNARFLEVTGLSRGVAIGEEYSLIKRIIEDGFRSLSTAVEAVTDGKSAEKRVTLEMCHPEDAPVERRLPAEARVTETRTAGGRNGVLVTLRDISNLRAKQRKLEQQNERLSQFASVVSHDLQTPLQTATMRLELAREDCDSPHLQDIADTHTRLEQRIDDLLTFAQLGSEAIDPEPVALDRLVAECWAVLETTDATLTLNTERTVRAARDHLRQLFENLLTNAVKHAGPDVSITVGGLEDGFYVEDDGPGIPDDARSDVFDAGYSSSQAGTGFGLSIVEQVVEGHAWEVQVTDGDAGGARFEITGVEFSG